MTTSTQTLTPAAPRATPAAPRDVRPIPMSRLARV